MKYVFTFLLLASISSLVALGEDRSDAVYQAAPDPILKLRAVDGRALFCKLIEVADGKAEIVRKDGKPFSIPLDQLDRQSRRQVADVIEERTPKGLEITSIKIKQIDNRFRYFFRIRNHGPDSWDGAVKITLLNHTPGITNGTETFETETPMVAGGATVVSMDAHTGPNEAAFGEARVESYSATFSTNGEQPAPPVTSKLTDDVVFLNP